MLAPSPKLKEPAGQRKRRAPMIPREVCLFPLYSFSPTSSRIQSWMFPMGSSSHPNRACIAGQFVKGTHRG
jgi:hypothetical protein